MGLRPVYALGPRQIRGMLECLPSSIREILANLLLGHPIRYCGHDSLLGSRIELMEVIAMARDGYIHADTTEFPLEEAGDVYAKLKAGKILGRAVLVPNRA